MYKITLQSPVAFEQVWHAQTKEHAQKLAADLVSMFGAVVISIKKL